MELRIKEILKEKGETAVWLASQISITQPNMSNIVSGKTNPSLETLEKIANALKVSISDLFEKPEIPKEDQEDTIRCPKCGTELELKEK